MPPVFDTQSYELSWLSAPFAVAAAAFVVTLLYVAFMRGALLLRLAWMLIVVSLLPYLVASAAAGSTINPEVAEALYRWGGATLPLASAGVLVFLLALSRRLAEHATLAITSIVIGLGSIVWCVTTDYVTSGVWKTPAGLYYFRNHPAALVVPISLIPLWVGIGIAIVWPDLASERSALRRRQLRGSVFAFGASIIGMVDLPLGFEIGYYPVSWLFLTVGALVALRSLVLDDLIQGSSFDIRSLFAIGYVAIAAAAIALTTYALGDASFAVVAATLVALFLVFRTTGVVVYAVAGRRPAKRDTPLARVVDQYVERLQRVEDEEQVARHTFDALELGLGGGKHDLLLPSADDYSWRRAGGEVLGEAETPDPLIAGWMLEHLRPIRRDDLQTLRLGELRDVVDDLFEAHGAEVIMPVGDRDELVALLVAGERDSGRNLRDDELRLFADIGEHAAQALVYARMRNRATTRVALDKEVELAAAVQGAYVPSVDEMDCGALTLSGIYAPATQCGGDWWSVHELGRGRVLVMVGDVTGHGVAAAMVTAAAKGCYDIAHRLMGDDIALDRLVGLLDASVRRVGAGHFNMTCFATILDPERGEATYVNAGHVVPYLVRETGAKGKSELTVFLARGNPLGAGDRPSFRTGTTPIGSGDVIVWYTDGITECLNPQQQQYGDRRMQRLLRRMGAPAMEAREVRDHLMRAVMAFQDGVPADDDITLVVGKVA